MNLSTGLADVENILLDTLDMIMNKQWRIQDSLTLGGGGDNILKITDKQEIMLARPKQNDW